MNETGVIEEPLDKLCQRVTGNVLDKHIWRIWDYVRTNKDSMDSESACLEIRRHVEKGVGQLSEKLANMKIDRDRAVGESAAARRSLTKANKKIRELQKALKECEQKGEGV